MTRRWIIALLLCVASGAQAQTSVVLAGKAIDSAGVGLNAVISVRPSSDEAVEIAHGVTAADGGFQVKVSALPGRVLVEATTSGGLVARVELDSLIVRGSAERPILLHLRSPHSLAPVQVRARFQRRPSVFNFFEGEPSTRVEPVGPVTEWLDPLSVGGIGALLRASPDLLVTADGVESVMGAPGSSNQLQIGGVRVPNGLISGQLSGNISASPWDATIGGAAGATVNLFLAPAGRYRTANAIARSGLGGVPEWVSPPGQPVGVNMPLQVSIGTTGPIGRFGYRANVFFGDDVTNLPSWDRTLGDEQRRVLDSLSGIFGAPTVRPSERTVQAGVTGRLDILPFNDKRVLAFTSALTRSTKSGGTRGGFLTGSVGSDLVEDVGLLQLESTRVLGERLLWTSIVSTSLTRSELARTTVAPTIIVTDTTAGRVFLTGGAPPLPTSGVVAAEARTTGTWYSTNNKIRYVAQLQTRLERARVDGQGPHSTFIVGSMDALQSGQAIALTRENGSGTATASSFIVAPAVSARYDLGTSGSLLLGLRADAWTTTGVATSAAMRYIDLSPRVSLLHRFGTRRANHGPLATLRVGAGRFTDWPSVQQWSDAWHSGASRSVCAGASVPAIVLVSEAPACADVGTVQTIDHAVAGRSLRPTAANRADVSLAISEIAPGTRAEFGAALAQNSRMTVRQSPFGNLSVIDRLTGENGRALLVSTTAIGAAGIVPIAQIPSGLPDAIQLVSNARSTAIQWRARLATRDPFARTKWNAVYTYTTGRERSLAIASPTGVPSLVSGPLASGGQHTFALSLGEWIGDADIRLAGIARSGVRFTPLADRDLNGDGRINDAAFIPQAESNAWASIVSPSLRSCIRASAGRIAAMNSCVGPWNISSLFLASIPGARVGLPRGSAVEVQVSNPLATLARTNRITFGNVTMVDPILVHVTGFDATAQRFRGEPLKGFGIPVGLAPGVSDPVRLAVSIRIPLGQSVTSQRADVALRALRGDTSSRVRQGAALAYLGDLPPIPIVVLQSAEGIQLTAEQRRALQALAVRWQSSATRIVADAVRSDGQLSDGTRAHQRLVGARAEFMSEARAIAMEIRRVLSADQIDELPDGVQRLLNPRFLQYVSLQDASTN